MRDYKFTKEIPNYGDLIEIQDWLHDVVLGLYTDEDGTGNWVKDRKMTESLGDPVCDKYAISDAVMDYGVTHVCWFNK